MKAQFDPSLPAARPTAARWFGRTKTRSPYIRHLRQLPSVHERGAGLSWAVRSQQSHCRLVVGMSRCPFYHCPWPS